MSGRLMVIGWCALLAVMMGCDAVERRCPGTVIRPPVKCKGSTIGYVDDSNSTALRNQPESNEDNLVAIRQKLPWCKIHQRTIIIRRQIAGLNCIGKVRISTCVGGCKSYHSVDTHASKKYCSCCEVSKKELCIQTVLLVCRDCSIYKYTYFTHNPTECSCNKSNCPK